MGSGLLVNNNLKKGDPSVVSLPDHRSCNRFGVSEFDYQRLIADRNYDWG